MAERARVAGAAAALLGLVLALSLSVRVALHTRVAREPGRPQAGWFSADPDTLYHARRVARALAAGGAVDPRDPFLAYPTALERGGAPIPWPPLYTRVVTAIVAPFLGPIGSPSDRSDAAPAPAGAEPRIERLVATLPCLLGSLASCLAALAAWRLAGPAAALFAGAHHALSFGALRYSALGNGDHHAWVSLLHLGLLAVLAGGLQAPWVERRRPGLAGLLRGLAAGALAGALLASWVASIVYVLLAQLALALALLLRARRAAAGHLWLGLGFHVAALATVLPAVLASPWRAERPWDLVNLSWLHPSLLAAGLVGLAPALAHRGGRPGPRRLAAGLALATGCVLALLLGPARAGLAEALGWAAAGEPFMAAVRESQPLLGAIEGAGALPLHLGWSAPLLPLAAAWLAWRSRRRAELLPLACVLPVLLLLALLQRRFAEGLAGPQAIALGVGLAALFGAARARLGRSRQRARAHAADSPPRPLLAGIAALALAIASHPEVGARACASLRAGIPYPESPHRAQQRSLRVACEWLRANSPAPGTPPDYCVLAQWDLGHTIEWAAARPTIATNFGSYLGEASYLDPWRFFLELEEERAEARLTARAARYVLVGADFRRNLGTMLDALGHGGEGGLDHWRASVGARLLAAAGWEVAGGADAAGGLGFLRLVHLSPLEGPAAPSAAAGAAVFEHVAGARLERAAAPGIELVVRLRLAGAGSDLFWEGRGRAGSDGVARVRVPHATEAVSGRVQARGPARWHAGREGGEVAIPERAVRLGIPILIP